jgi:sporulation protein YlmC with PRC-barrel domain
MLTAAKSVGLWLIFLSMAAPVCAETNVFYPPLKAQRLMGMKVENGDGEELGKLHDFAVDMPTGQIRFVILASGGFWGAGVKLKAVPPQLLSAATAKRNILAMNVTKARWNSAPVCKVNDIASLAHAERAAQINRFYGETGSEADPAKVKIEGGLIPTGMQKSRRTEFSNPSLTLASDLIGRRVMNRQRGKIGEISDLLVSFNGPRMAFAIVSSGRFFRNREQEYIVPLRAFTPAIDKRDLLVDANRLSLQQARVFDERIWQRTDVKEPEIYRYKENAVR